MSATLDPQLGLEIATGGSNQPPPNTVPQEAESANTPSHEQEQTAHRSPREDKMLEIYAAVERRRAVEIADGVRAERESRIQAREHFPDLEIDPDEAERRALAEQEENEATLRRMQEDGGVGAAEVAGRPEPSPRAAVPQAAPPPASAPQPQQTLRTVVVDGQPLQLTEEQVIELARLGAVTNRELGRYRQQQQYAQPPQQAPQPPPQRQAPPPPSRALTEEDARALARKMQYGDADDTAQAIMELADRLKPQPQVDPNLIVNAAVQRAMQQATLNENLGTLGREFPDIFSNNLLSRTAVHALTDVRAEDEALGRQRTDLDAYREACSRVRALRGGTQPQPQGHQSGQSVAPAAPRVGNMTDREQRVRAAPMVPQAAARKATTAGTERPPTGAEIVAQMRKSRGLPSMG